MVRWVPPLRAPRSTAQKRRAPLLEPAPACCSAACCCLLLRRLLLLRLLTAVLRLATPRQGRSLEGTGWRRIAAIEICVRCTIRSTMVVVVEVVVVVVVLLMLVSWSQ